MRHFSARAATIIWLRQERGELRTLTALYGSRPRHADASLSPTRAAMHAVSLAPRATTLLAALVAYSCLSPVTDCPVRRSAASRRRVGIQGTTLIRLGARCMSRWSKRVTKKMENSFNAVICGAFAERGCHRHCPTGHAYCPTVNMLTP